MDSMALYRGMDIGTAKPTAEQRRAVPHHLYNLDTHNRRGVKARFGDFLKQSQHRNGERLAWGPGGGNERPWSANGLAETWEQGCPCRVVRSLGSDRSLVCCIAHMVDTHSCRPGFRPSHIVRFTGRSAQSQ
ncbi:MAG: hypothetical protein JXB10_00160, partial [Pirellulales bacterium]|nr:hypothetical protein [Pirellulales bacterium]